MREKRHWEVQIKSLGGPDHARVGPKMLDQDGKEVPGNRGYKYFGAAKDLPGTELFFFLRTAVKSDSLILAKQALVKYIYSNYLILN